ncbi:MAG: Lrp/AsnC family transcriptional regulator [Maricaulaceae bacterium]
MNELDRIDIRILKELQKNARITNLALSENVHLSASACLVRVQKLRDAGVIEKDISIITTSKIGPVLHSLLQITLENHDLSDHRQFEKNISPVSEITLALKVSGRFDYLLSVTVRDMPALNALSDHLLGGDFGIAKLVTIPVIDIPKPFSGFPIDSLNDTR